MFTNNKNIEMKYYTYLEVFLAVISKLNPTIFHQFETLEIDLEKLEEFYKLKDIQLAEQKLHSLFENETFNIKLPIHISKNDISSELKTINDIYFNNKNIFDTNEDFYRSYISSNELKTKRDLIDLLKETKDNEVSENHIDLINKAKRIIVILSFFILNLVLI